MLGGACGKREKIVRNGYAGRREIIRGGKREGGGYETLFDRRLPPAS